MNQELKEQAREIMCANLIAFEENTPEDKKAELRPKVIFAILDSLIDKTVQKTEDRIVEMIEKNCEDYGQRPYDWHGYRHASKDIISLITNKSDINK